MSSSTQIHQSLSHKTRSLPDPGRVVDEGVVPVLALEHLSEPLLLLPDRPRLLDHPQDVRVLLTDGVVPDPVQGGPYGQMGGWVEVDTGSSPSSWVVSVTASRMVEHPKSFSTKHSHLS